MAEAGRRHGKEGQEEQCCLKLESELSHTQRSGSTSQLPQARQGTPPALSLSSPCASAATPMDCDSSWVCV